jgi:hypothetical protein
VGKGNFIGLVIGIRYFTPVGERDFISLVIGIGYFIPMFDWG